MSRIYAFGRKGLSSTRRPWLVRLASALVALCFGITSGFAQTTLISATGDGGFENGSSFAANGWQTVNNTPNGTVNAWWVGSASTPFAGSNAAYVSNSLTGTTYTYNVGSATGVWFFRDVTFPAGQPNINLQLQVKVNGESGNWDQLLIYTAATTFTPALGTPSGSTTAITGYNLVYAGVPLGGGAAYNALNFWLPASLSGTTQRLMFCWKNDTSFGASPPASVDNISLTSQPAAAVSSTGNGGLWSSPATWSGGTVPLPGDNVTIASGATVTVDQVVTANTITVNGVMNWNATATNSVTTLGNFTVGSGGRLLTYTTALTGPTIFCGSSFVNDGYVNMATGALRFNGTGAMTLGSGTGTWASSASSGRALVSALIVETATGSLTISPGGPDFVVIQAAGMIGALNTSNKIFADVSEQFYGQAANQSVETVVVTGMGAGYTSAPTVTFSAPTGAGVTATGTANFDLATGTVRSITITDAGSGYRSAPTITLTGGGFATAAVATAVVPTRQGAGTGGAFNMQKGSFSTITGGFGIASDLSVGNAFTTNGGVGYSSAPTVGFSLPTGVQCLISSDALFTTAPTVTLTGGGFTTAATATATLAQGRVVSVYITAGGTGYTSLPTITISGGGGTATAALPPACLATATATVTNGMVSNISMTNLGYGYLVEPTVTLTGGGATTVASGASCRRQLYNLTYGQFLPAPTFGVITESAEMPASRKINALTVNTSFGVNITGPLAGYGAAPLTLTAGIINMNGNQYHATSQTYTGIAGSATAHIFNGSFRIDCIGGAVGSRTFPLGPNFAFNPGTTPTAVTTGSTITTMIVSHAAAPTGTSDFGSVTGSRSFRLQTSSNSGVTIAGTNPTVTPAFRADDLIVSDNASLRIVQATATAGPWTNRSLTTGTGALPGTGTRTSATAAPGPIVITGNDFFGWASTFATPPALSYDVARTTSVPYVTIVGQPGTVNTGLNGDENWTAAVPVTSTFSYQGATMTQFRMNTNGFITLNSTGTPTAWFNRWPAMGFNIIAPFWEDNVVAGSMYYRADNLGTGTGTLTCEWTQVETFLNAGPNMNFQVVLRESSNVIEFNYGVMQGFDGTVSGSGAYAYSYSVGVCGNFILGLPQSGQIFAQQDANTRNFSHVNGHVQDRGANDLSAMPECYSRLTLTPGAYTPYTPVSSTPANDNPAGAVVLTALPAPPADLCGTYYTTFGATETVAPAPSCVVGGNDDDVWFKFNCINPNTNIEVASTGGVNMVVEVYNDFGNNGTVDTPVAGSCQNSTGEGLKETLNLTGLTISQDYFVRVFHQSSGVTATGTAVVSGGSVIAVNVDNGGTGYARAAYGGFSNQKLPRVRLVGGGGTNAVVTANTSGTVGAYNSISSFTVGSGGAGYSSAPTVVVDPPGAGISGDFSIAVFATPAPPVNDDICGAVSVVPAFTCAYSPGPILAAASASPQGNTCGGVADDDVWYSFVAASSNDQFEVDPTSALYNPVIEVFSAATPNDCTGTLTSIACVNTGGTGATEVYSGSGLTVGQTYFVRVYHFGSGSSAGAAFQYCATTPPCGLVNVPSVATTSVGAFSAAFSWGSVPAATSYSWQIVPGGNAPGVGVVASGGPIPGLTANVPSGLTASTSYTFYVQATCPLGVTNWTALNFSTNPDCATSPLLSCNTPVAGAIGAGTGVWSPGACGFGTPGAERVYRFTAADCGAHTVVHNTTDAWIDYFWKDASGTCDASGWTCLDDVISATPLTIGTINLSAGQSIYILVDPEGTAGANFNFQINCPTGCSAPAVTSVTPNPALGQASVSFTSCAGTSLIEYGLSGFTPGTGATAGVGGTVINPATSPQLITGLASSQEYQVYVRRECTPGVWSPNSAVSSFNTYFTVPFTGTTVYNGNCNYTLYDHAGPANYSPNAGGNQVPPTGTAVLTPTSGSILHLVGTYDIESCCDRLYIYDGVGTGGTLLGDFAGTGTFDIYATGVNSSITVGFESDGSVQPQGFSINVTCEAACAGVPAPGATTTTSSVVCPGSPFTLGTSAGLSALGLSYIWQSGPSFAGPWTTLTTTTANTYAVPTQTVNTWYRVRVNCSYSGQTGIGTPVQVTMAPICYPIPPAPTSAADTDLGSVQVGGGTNTTDCVTLAPGAGSILGDYSSYLNQPVFTNLVRGGTSSFNIARQQCGFGGPYSSNAAIYIDFNQNGVFELSEEVYDAGQLTTTPYTGTFNIPVTASLGQTGMRVIAAESFTDITPTLVFTWGEVEDYLVNIVNPAAANDFIALAQPITSGAFPTCSALATANLPVATDSPESNGLGNDVWYSFVATTNAARIAVVGDASPHNTQIELRDGAGVIATENDNTANGNETMIVDNLTAGNTYFVGVTQLGGSATATVCVSHLRRSTCDNPATFNSPCTNYKSQFTSANSYTVTFDDNGVAPFLATATSNNGLTTIPLSAFTTLPPMTSTVVYQVKVDATYNLADAAGNTASYTVPGLFNCTRTVNPHAGVFLRNSDASPNVKPANALVAANAWLCGSLYYEWSIEQFDAIGGISQGLPTVVNGPPVNRFLNLTGLGLVPNGIYKVNVRPVFASGPGNLGPDRWLIIAGPAPMILDENQAQAFEKNGTEATIESALYPNPSNGSFVNLNITGVEANVMVRVLDGMGRVVWINNLVVEGSLNTIIAFERPLASGLYTVEMTYDGKVITERLMVQK